ncbi:hypothetical protein H0H92_015868, partial [Tricholoma furcatifolium]
MEASENVEAWCTEPQSNGIAMTPLGSCAVECPACPLPEKNMPEDWRNGPREK